MTYTYPPNPALTVNDATLLGEGSSLEPGKDRWGTVRVFGVDDAYIVEECGHSSVPGETDRWHLHVYHDPVEVVRSLLRGANRRLPRHAFDALDAAADFDPGIEEALHSYEESRTWR